MPDQEIPPSKPTPRRQYVNFVFYKVDPAWRRLPEDERSKGNGQKSEHGFPFPGVLEMLWWR